MKHFLLAQILASFFSSAQSQAQTAAHGAYTLFPQGSIRVIGMGGAFAALSDDASGMLFNPAGMAQGKWKYDFGAATIQVDNIIGADSEAVTDINQKYTVQFYTAAAKVSKNVVIGIGYSSPFKLEAGNVDSSFQQELSLQSLDLSLSVSFGKISLGATGHYEQSTLRFRDDTVSIALIEEKNTIIYPTLGVSFREKKGGFGISYVPKRTHDIDESVNSANFGSFWFRDVQIPGKVTVGAFFYARENLLIVVDLDLVEAPDNAIVAGTGTNSAADGTALLEQKRSVLHGGIEYLFLKNSSAEVRMLAGGYEEPTLIEGDKTRLHLTLGLEVRLGPVVLGVSYDQAKNFQNTAAGLSLSLGDI
ncbi:hypothetical protein COB52_03705 [Candidatus Kaiserbacteria bacterium]|nr:MAG: hypothetical protein COB52_03705 [Candidatus Kaiserbacteria bacterium]